MPNFSSSIALDLIMFSIWSISFSYLFLLKESLVFLLIFSSTSKLLFLLYLQSISFCSVEILVLSTVVGFSIICFTKCPILFLYLLLISSLNSIGLIIYNSSYLFSSPSQITITSPFYFSVPALTPIFGTCGSYTYSFFYQLN